MNQQREPGSADTTYRYLHLSPEELAQMPPDELLQACLDMRRMLDIIMGVLYTPDSTLILRAVTIDLLYSEAERLSRQQGAGEELPVTYNIKTVSERLGIRPASVREAYEQLDAMGGVHIVPGSFHGGENGRYHCPLMTQESVKAKSRRLRCQSALELASHVSDFHSFILGLDSLDSSFSIIGDIKSYTVPICSERTIIMITMAFQSEILLWVNIKVLSCDYWPQELYSSYSNILQFHNRV